MIPELPEGYYLENFRYLVEFVHERYEDVLSDQELAFVSTFAGLSQDGQKALVRLLGRRHDYVRRDKFEYQEISDLETALNELQEQDLVRRNDLDDGIKWLTFATKAELVDAFPETEFPGVKKSLRKGDICLAIAKQADLDIVRQKLNFELISSPIGGVVEVFRLLFFGNLHQDFTDFVLHEMGVIPYEQYPLDKQGRYFKSRQVLEDTLKAYEVQAMAQLVFENESLSLAEFAQDFLLQCDVQEPALERRYSKIFNRAARQLEREAEAELALVLYQKSSLAPARERTARLLAGREEIPEALRVCRQIISSPQTESEFEFACSFSQRTAKKLEGNSPPWVPPKTRDEFQTIQLTLPKVEALGVEETTAEYFREQGAVSEHIENGLLPGLFGLLFWEAVYAPVDGAFFHPFQRGPADLFSDQFVPARQELVDDALRLLHKTAELEAKLLKTFEQKLGLANPFIMWRYLSPELIQLALERIPAAHLEAVFRRMLRDLKENRSGFPDLVVFPESGGYELVEVKGPGDTLQANQKRWLRCFQEHSIPASVVYIFWQESSVEAAI
jgi:hypothetical protein